MAPGLDCRRTLFRVGGGSKTRDNRRNEVERLARALPGLGVGVFAATWLCCEGVAGAFVNMRHPTRSARCEEPLHRNMERLTLGGRGTVADRVGGRNDRSANRHGARTGLLVARDRSRKTLNVQRAKPSARSLERGEDGAPLISAKPHSGRPRPTAASRSSPPWSEAEGSAAAADVLARQRELPTGGYGTAKGAAGLARHVPTRAKNEPGRADAVTGQTSDRR